MTRTETLAELALAIAAMQRINRRLLRELEAEKEARRTVTEERDTLLADQDTLIAQQERHENALIEARLAITDQVQLDAFDTALAKAARQ